VEGLSPFSLRFVRFFEETSLDPTGTRSRVFDVAADRVTGLIFAIDA
jgi:hypothetical protein